MSHDAVSLLRSLRPADPELEPDERALERILLAPPLPRPPRRHRARRPLALVVAVALAALAVAIAPSLRSSPDVVARAAAALNDPSTILHLKSVQGDTTEELWQADGGRRERWLFKGGTDKALEHAEDWDAKTAQSYSAERDELITHTEPDLFDPAHRVPRGLGSASVSAQVIDDLAALLDRARRGEGNARLAGETSVRGIPVYQLEIAFTMEVVDLPPGETVTDPTGLPKKTLHLSRTVYVNREDFLPVRLVEHLPGLDFTTDYVVAERLPMTPANEALLRMTPHPGAKRVTEGRV
jgi:hypothetical protein